GLRTEEFNLGWVARRTSPETGAHLQLVTRDDSAPVNPVISVKVDDVDAAYEDAVQRGYEIVHPLQDEEWGVRRFFVRAPDGNVRNIVGQRERSRAVLPTPSRIPTRIHGGWRVGPGPRGVIRSPGPSAASTTGSGSGRRAPCCTSGTRWRSSRYGPVWLTGTGGYGRCAPRWSLARAW